MKLFVWDSVLTDYTSGIAVAAAETIEDARRVLLAVAETEGDAGALASDLDLYEPRVLDLPAGAYCYGGG